MMCVLIGSENWPRPLSAHLSVRAQGEQVMNSSIHENNSVIVHRSMIGSHCWQKTGKIAVLFGETRFDVKGTVPQYKAGELLFFLNI